MYVERLGKSSLTFKLIGKKDNKIETFSAKLVCCFVSRPDNAVIEPPKDYREKIENYIANCE